MSGSVQIARIFGANIGSPELSQYVVVVWWLKWMFNHPGASWDAKWLSMLSQLCLGGRGMGVNALRLFLTISHFQYLCGIFFKSNFTSTFINCQVRSISVMLSGYVSC